MWYWYNGNAEVIEMVKKVYLKLTEDQIARGVIFSSTLSRYQIEQEEDYTCEVLSTTEEKEEEIKRLQEDFFFNQYKPYNIIRR